MIIHLVRTGGFGGLRREVTVETGTLPPSDRETLERLVAAAGFFSLPARFPGPARGADYFTYTLTVRDGDCSHTVEAPQPSLPERLRPLVRELAKRLVK